MTRRDYEMLAHVLRRELMVVRGSLYGDIRAQTVRDTARAIAEEIKADNPRFDVERFMRDCNAT